MPSYIHQISIFILAVNFEDGLGRLTGLESVCEANVACTDADSHALGGRCIELIKYYIVFTKYFTMTRTEVYKASRRVS